MRPAAYLSTLLLAAGLVAPGAARGAELKILAPKDKSVLRGQVQFTIRPVDAPGERFFSNPEILIQNESGQTVHRLEAVKDNRTGLCAVSLDTTRLADGTYLVSILYRNLAGGTRAQRIREDLTLAVRNRGLRPLRAVVELAERPYRVGETDCEVVVRVYDQHGRLMPAARVAFSVDAGILDSDAEITDTGGEASVTVESDVPQIVTLSIRVETLAPIRRTIRFVP